MCVLGLLGERSQFGNGKRLGGKLEVCVCQLHSERARPVRLLNSEG